MSLSTKVLFFCFSSLLLLPCQKTLVFRFFSINSQVILKNSRPLASNFSILLSNLLKKISIQEFYDTETTTARRKQKNKTLVDRKQLLNSFVLTSENGSQFFPPTNFRAEVICIGFITCKRGPMKKNCGNEKLDSMSVMLKEQ